MNHAGLQCRCVGRPNLIKIKPDIRSLYLLPAYGDHDCAGEVIHTKPPRRCLVAESRYAGCRAYSRAARGSSSSRVSAQLAR